MFTMRLGAALALSFMLFSACSSTDPSEAVRSESESLCIDNVLCIAGTHWDATACKCVPDSGGACVSGAGGPCGGFTQNPCSCAPGTHCVPNHIPDIPGVCAVCDPIRCPRGEHWDRSQCACVGGCRTAADCKGALPALCKLCADGTPGCAHFECVAHACEVAYCD